MTGTIKEIIAARGLNGKALNPQQMSVFLSVLENAGQVKRVGKVAKEPGKKGRLADIWELPEEVNLTFTEKGGNLAEPIEG